jgi:hypothetical protein
MQTAPSTFALYDTGILYIVQYFEFKDACLNLLNILIQDTKLYLDLGRRFWEQSSSTIVPCCFPGHA